MRVCGVCVCVCDELYIKVKFWWPGKDCAFVVLHHESRFKKVSRTSDVDFKTLFSCVKKETL